MTWQGRLAIIAVFVVTELSMGDAIPPWIGLPVLVVAALIAFRTVPRLWRILAAGLAGGAIAGLLILGPGFRVAMRAVALMDPTRAPEFTLEGTLFIVIGIGLFLGAVQGLTSHAVRRVLSLRSSVLAGSLLGVYVVGQLALFAGEVSEEFFELGAGAWVNIPMFGVFAIAYGIATMALADRFEQWTPKTKSAERAKVAA